MVKNKRMIKGFSVSMVMCIVVRKDIFVVKIDEKLI